MDTLKEIISALGEEQVFMRDSKEGIESGSESDSKLSMKILVLFFRNFVEEKPSTVIAIYRSLVW